MTLFAHFRKAPLGWRPPRVPFVVSKLIALPHFDDGFRRPATLSPRILRKLLRDELQFDGVTISDATRLVDPLKAHKSAEEIERYVTIPVEVAMAGLPNLMPMSLAANVSMNLALATGIKNACNSAHGDL